MRDNRISEYHSVRWLLFVTLLVTLTVLWFKKEELDVVDDLDDDDSPSLRRRYRRGWRKHFFNELASDMESLRRHVPDLRDDDCKRPELIAKILPRTSVIICFHNEAWSTLVRTVYSVLDRSPPHLLEEIILVDDFSDADYLKEPLENFVKKLSKNIFDQKKSERVIWKANAANVDGSHKVKLIRTKRREGLVRARMLGVHTSVGMVITFLDSHCECAPGWLEPLLNEISNDPNTIASPVIDKIDSKTFKYLWKNSSSFPIGGFKWSMEFTWEEIPKRLSNRKSLIEPVPTPVIAGGIFSIRKHYFYSLGAYDEAMDNWGGENLELSFRTWMCGGKMKIVPCSHVGHVFRQNSPYTWINNEDTYKKNNLRVAMVWMDNYAVNYFKRIENILVDYGDVSSRTELRKKLGCKSFDWYLKNVYPELEIDNDIAYGEIRNPATHLCIDSVGRGIPFPVGLWRCLKRGGNQYWSLSARGELHRDKMCIEVSRWRNIVQMNHCREHSSQLWRYMSNKRFLVFLETGKCLTIHDDNKTMIVDVCDPSNLKQKWFFSYN